LRKSVGDDIDVVEETVAVTSIEIGVAVLLVGVDVGGS